MTNPTNPSKSAGLGGTVFEFPMGKRRAVYEEAAHPALVLDLLKHLPDCTFKRYAEDVAKMCWLPKSSVLVTGIGVASVAISRAYAVQYPDGTLLPLGEYVMPCNPSATAKSRCLKSFQKPMFEATKKAVKRWQEQKEANPDPDTLPPFPEGFFITNSTSAALDGGLEKTNGFFGLVSAEQGLINTITGAAFSGGKATQNDNDLMLLGFNGDYHRSQRAGRGGYAGDVVGSVTCFAQPKAILTILQQSGGSGMAERFLLLNEPTLLGQRDHHQKFYPKEYDQNTYNRIVADIADKALQDQTRFDDLPAYRLSKAAWWAIDEFRNEIEPFLADGGKYSTETLRSMAGKPDIHIMKIATILAVLDESPVGEVPDKWVTAAIEIVRDYLEYILSLLVDMGEIGTNANEDSVIAYLSEKGKATRRQFDQARRKAKPWAEITPKSAIGKVMAETIDGLITKGVIVEVESFDSGGGSQGKTLRMVS